MVNKFWQQYIKLPIKDLCLWDENARFPEEYFKKSDKELISYFLSDENKYGIRKLADEIISELDIPQFEQLLVYDSGINKIVLEGNRRLTVYKLLADPLLSDDAEIQQLFIKLNKKARVNEKFILAANITNNKKEAYRYIDRKHNKANNEKSWTGVERDHFSFRRNKGGNEAVFKVEMTRRVKSLDLEDEIKFAVLGRGYETTFWRIIKNKSARKKLGYDVLEDGRLTIKNENNFNKILRIIVYNVWNKKAFDGNIVNSRDLNKSEQVQEYLENLSEKDSKKVDEAIEKGKSKDQLGKKNIQKKNNKATKGKLYGNKQDSFSSLINPKTLEPKVSLPKIKEVFKELQIIKVSSCSTATFALVRILTDITIKHFLDLKGYKFNPHGHLIIKSAKENNKKELKEKMNYIATKYLIGDLKASVVALNEDLLTQNLNQVMHNTIFHASEKQIRSFWKNLFPFLEFMWGEIIKIEPKK